MSKGGRKYRKMMSFLDSVGFVISIQRIHNKRYSLIINGEIIKTFRKRDSCNKRITKMFNQNQVK
jgi:hypothetical protein